MKSKKGSNLVIARLLPIVPYELNIFMVEESQSATMRYQCVPVLQMKQMYCVSSEILANNLPRAQGKSLPDARPFIISGERKTHRSELIMPRDHAVILSTKLEIMAVLNQDLLSRCPEQLSKP
jgi:hypothetical protein